MKDATRTKPLLIEALLSSLFHIVLLVCVVMTPLATAAENTTTELPKVVAIGGLKTELSDEVKKEKMSLAQTLNVNTAQGKTREQIKASKASLAKLDVTKQSAQRAGHYHSFTIYDAQSYLEEDIDYDGFYRTFSVVFDADVINTSHHDVSEVFADLYLSKNGGPWIHYFTTDIFLIYGESTEDEYEVLTTLIDGYSTDHYDVLIDLYEVGYPDVVATLSSDDVNTLYALPLESANYDYYEEHYESHGHAGAINTYFLLVIVLSFFLGKIIKRKHL